MTTSELNRDIKRLAKMDKRDKDGDLIPAIENEFRRLYSADIKLEYMNRTNIIIMFRLNLLYRIVPFHQFGIQVDDAKLGITV